MKVAVFTLTRDRLAFTQHCFETLWAKAGYPFDHFVIDNGSEDGTAQWLAQNGPQFTSIQLYAANRGISAGANLALELILAPHRPHYDLIVKVDNDCELVGDNVLLHVVDCAAAAARAGLVMALSPRVEGITRQPTRAREEQLGDYRVGITGIIGGLFQAVPSGVYERYRFPTTLPLARGQDDHFCDWMLKQGVTLGYLEDVAVKHYLTTDGQAQALPEYFVRKRREEQEVPQ